MHRPRLDLDFLAAGASPSSPHTAGHTDSAETPHGASFSSAPTPGHHSHDLLPASPPHSTGACIASSFPPRRRSAEMGFSAVGSPKRTARESNRLAQARYRQRLKKLQQELKERILDTRVKLHEAESRREHLTGSVLSLRTALHAAPAAPTYGRQGSGTSTSSMSHASSSQSLRVPAWMTHRSPGPSRGLSPPLPQPASQPWPIPGKSASPTLTSAQPPPQQPAAAQSLTDLPPLRAHLMRGTAAALAAPSTPVSDRPTSPPPNPPTPQPLNPAISLDISSILQNAAPVEHQASLPQHTQHAQQAQQRVQEHRSMLAEGLGRPVEAVKWFVLAPFSVARGAPLSFSSKLRSAACCASFLATSLATSLEMTLLRQVLQRQAGAASAVPYQLSELYGFHGRYTIDHETPPPLRRLAAVTAAAAHIDAAPSCCAGAGDAAPLRASMHHLFQTLLLQYRTLLPRAVWLDACCELARVLLGLQPRFCTRGCCGIAMSLDAVTDTHGCDPLPAGAAACVLCSTVLCIAEAVMSAYSTPDSRVPPKDGVPQSRLQQLTMHAGVGQWLCMTDSPRNACHLKLFLMPQDPSTALHGDSMHASHSMIADVAPEHLAHLEAAWSAWAHAQRSAAAQHDAARSALQQLPVSADLSADVSLAIMMWSITDTGGGAGSVEELLESDDGDTELDALDEHLAILTSADEAVPLPSFPGVLATGTMGLVPHRPGSAHSMEQPGRSESAPSGSAGLDASGRICMRADSPVCEKPSVSLRAWRPLGGCVEAQQAAEVAMGALAIAHDAAAMALADAAAAVCTWGGQAAVTAAAFARGQGLPDVLLAACAAHERLQRGALSWAALSAGQMPQVAAAAAPEVEWGAQLRHWQE
eukprot:jgi/Ulvmu1/10937/UM007_0116.1